jgi:hypothetical protein
VLNFRLRFYSVLNFPFRRFVPVVLDAFFHGAKAAILGGATPISTNRCKPCKKGAAVVQRLRLLRPAAGGRV